MKILVVQHSALEGSGTLGNLLRGDGHTLRVVPTWQKAPPAESDGWPLAIVLGGPQNADEERLADVRRCVAGRLRRNLPTLGICLGAQLIATVAGGRVYRGGPPEIGFFHDITIQPSNSATPDAPQGLFNGLPSPLTAFQWHAETFDPPAGAQRLAASSHYPNQAFRIGNAIGLQFHIEIDAPLVNLWLANGLDHEARAIGTDPALIRADSEHYGTEVGATMRHFYRNLMGEFWGTAKP